MSKKRRRHAPSPLPHSIPARSADSTRDASRIAARAAKLSRVLSLTDIEDHRRYQHDSYRPLDPLPAPRPAKSRQKYYTVFGARAEHKVQPARPIPGYGGLFPMRPVLSDRFSQPRQTIVCVRRKTRRSVLFALSRIGRGSGPLRRARWSESSYIRCK